MTKKWISVLLAGVLTCGMISLSGCGAENGTADSGEVESAVELTEEDLEEEDLEDDGLEEFDAEEAGDDSELVYEEDGEDIPETEEEKAFNGYLEKNTITELLKNHKNIEFVENNTNPDGSEVYAYTMYVDPDLRLTEYTDGFQEIITKDRYDGFDSERNVPVRYVFYDEEMKNEQIDASDDLIFLWAGEVIEEQGEEDGAVVFKSFVRDASYVDMSLYDENTTAEDGDILSRVTKFDKESGDLISSVVTFEKKGGDASQVAEYTLKADVETKTPDAELLAKLDGKDTHKLSLTLDPGTEDEVVMTSEVGKGCAFYPYIYDGYTFYEDKECTKEVDEDTVYGETEKDLTIYAVYEYDEDLDGEEIVLDGDDLDIEDAEEGEDGEELSDSDLTEVFGIEEADESGVVG
ncbi:MAG: InlB B-repeat-containing protein [Lachnospiraceae bacterium]|nr:InlB B-repeat-containing protein [Lachnospiraceae bacterium]